MEKKDLRHATDEYSISPTSGRLRKRVRVRKKKSFFSKKRTKKIFEYFLWIVIIVAFLYSLMVVIPELGIVSDKNPKKDAPKGR
jgi:hypothetical protein